MKAQVIWKPSDLIKNESNLSDYMNWLRRELDLEFDTYEQLWEWSVEDVAVFWQSIWDYFSIDSSTPYDQVLDNVEKMPTNGWFPGARINYAAHVFKNSTEKSPAIIYKNETQKIIEVSWKELENKVIAVQQFLLSKGLKKGDTVCALMPNCPETTIMMLATVGMGMIWSSCSPDFGAESVVDRFGQLTPKILFTINGYSYNGKIYDKTKTVNDICQKLDSLETAVVFDFIESENEIKFSNLVNWKTIIDKKIEAALILEMVPFAHPIWVLYSSGTTGKPKAITHGHGGCLLEHLKYLTFHNDLKKGEKFFWYSTTGWMMWNFVQASLLVGATAVLYEGNPMYPNAQNLWQFAEDIKINHFGTSAPFIHACMNKGLDLNGKLELSALRSISSTGAPLSNEGFAYVHSHLKKDIWLVSMSGGTDVCTAFVGGCPIVPVVKGEIQVRALGCDLRVYDENQNSLVDEVGEMVIQKPMPSMPVCFWNDEDNKRYSAAYFEYFPNKWRHGDWIKVTDRGSLIIYGRSDATLNRGGIRIGTSEIYNALLTIAGIEDGVVVNLEKADNNDFMPLFVKMEQNVVLDEEKIMEIKKAIKTMYTLRHIPDQIIAVPDLPYTISGKKLEAPIKKILLGMDADKVVDKDALRNPESLAYFVKLKQDLIA